MKSIKKNYLSRSVDIWKFLNWPFQALRWSKPSSGYAYHARYEFSAPKGSTIPSSQIFIIFYIKSIKTCTSSFIVINYISYFKKDWGPSLFIPPGWGGNFGLWVNFEQLQKTRKMHFFFRYIFINSTTRLRKIWFMVTKMVITAIRTFKIGFPVFDFIGNMW